MIARVASFEGVNVEAARATMDEAEARIRPLMEGLAGFSGTLQLVAEDGKVLSVSFFDSEENAQAAEPTFDEVMPRELGDLFAQWSGHRTSVDLYDVAVDERT
jgi:hypothetical protein